MAEWSHEIFTKHVAVTYFKDAHAIDRLLLKRVNVNLPIEFVLDNRAFDEPEGFAYTDERRILNRVLTGLKTFSGHIQGWDVAGDIFSEALPIFDQW